MSITVESQLYFVTLIVKLIKLYYPMPKYRDSAKVPN